MFETMRLPAQCTVVAPDGSDVRVLLGLKGGGMAHFELVALEPGVCLTIPLGTRFQFKSLEKLEAVAVTMPPWPGEGEASEVPGRW